MSSAPTFGQWFMGVYASDDNPLQDGMYVRTVRRTGRMNPGTFYELTDGKGKFWLYKADEVISHDEVEETTKALAEAAMTPGTFSWGCLSEERREHFRHEARNVLAETRRTAISERRWSLLEHPAEEGAPDA